MVAFSSFTQAIYDCIIDQGCDDHNFLVSCSLTHSSLRNRAQKYIFNEIITRSCQRVRELLDLIDHNANIGTYITVINARCSQLSAIENSFWVLLKLLDDISPQLPLCIHLGLGEDRKADLATGCSIPPDALTHLLRRVTELQADYVCNLPSIMITSCTNLKSLALRETSTLPRYRAELTLGVSSNPARPHILHLSCGRCADFEDMVFLHRNFVDLQQLKSYECMSFSDYWEPGVDGIQFILDTSKGSLVEFHQDSFLKPGLNHSYIYTLQHNNHLLSLTLNTVSVGDVDYTGSIFYFTSVLRSIDPTNNVLEKVEFTVQIEIATTSEDSVKPVVYTPPALFTQADAVREWHALFLLLVRAAQGRALAVTLRVEGGLSPESAESYPGTTRIADGATLEATMQRWVEMHSEYLAGSRVTLCCSAGVMFFDEVTYYDDSDWDSSSSAHVGSDFDVDSGSDAVYNSSAHDHSDFLADMSG